MPERTGRETPEARQKGPSKTLNEIARLKDLVAKANRILFHEKLADYHGHVSARIPGTRTFLIKPYLVSLKTIRSKDILALDMDEYVTFLKSRQAPSEQRKKAPFRKEMQLTPGETILHVAIYEARPDVFSVVHTHQPLATAFGIANVPILPVSVLAARNAPCTPILQNPRIIRSIEMAQEAAQVLGEGSALLLRHHGVVVVGRTVEEATAGAVYLERNAHMQLVATILGNAAPIPEQFIPELAANMNRRAPTSFSYFASLLSK